jgi:hypothetical protein
LAQQVFGAVAGDCLILFRIIFLSLFYFILFISSFSVSILFSGGALERSFQGDRAHQCDRAYLTVRSIAHLDSSTETVVITDLIYFFYFYFFAFVI